MYDHNFYEGIACEHSHWLTTVEFCVYFQFLLCFITGVLDIVRVTVNDVSIWDGGGCGEEE